MKGQEKGLAKKKILPIHCANAKDRQKRMNIVFPTARKIMDSGLLGDPVRQTVLNIGSDRANPRRGLTTVLKSTAKSDRLNMPGGVQCGVYCNGRFCEKI